MKIFHILSTIILIVILFPSFSCGEEPYVKELFIAFSDSGKALDLSLQDCIVHALENNPDIQIKRMDPDIKDLDIEIAESSFSPEFSTELSFLENIEKSTSEFFGVENLETEMTTFDVSLYGRLRTGTRYSFSLDNKLNETNSGFSSLTSYYTITPQIDVSHPLLKGRGREVNEAFIVIARNTKEKSQYEFISTVMDIITRTKQAYYYYAFAQDSYEIAKSSLKRANDLLDITRKRYAKGLVSQVDLLETETMVAQREKLLIAAESQLKSAEDNLKFITNLVSDPEMWNAEVFLTDKPEFVKKTVSLKDALMTAFENRPDYKAYLLNIKNSDILLMLAENSTLPELDLMGSLALNGLDEEYRDTVEDLSIDRRQFLIGLKFTKTFGEEDDARFEQQKLQKAQLLLGLKKLEQAIILDVRDRVREIDIQSRQLQASDLSLEKEKKNYAAQKERYMAGEISTHDMLDYQDSLSQAELDYLKALIDYNVAVIQLECAQGTTLTSNNIDLFSQEGARN
ncbi:MAG: TolC family protein [Candidatus Aureabacteria bacterium]|nr:TolC family protein [Candidatus Auribacterota bacterium]